MLRHRLTLALVTVLPRNLASRLMGRLTSVRWPRFLRPWVMKRFGRTFGVNFSEVRDPLDSFASIQDFFTRRLVEGARPLDPDPEALISPCDGAWGMAGRIEAGKLFQLKGRPYSAASLLGSEEDAARFEGGAFATLYLSPKDYHRFHTPWAGEISRLRYLPGSLWPVNQVGLLGIDGLFAENERICAFMQRAGRQLCLVAVGATMVGKVRVAFDDLTTNEAGASTQECDYDPAVVIGRGDEWGRFEFGSTLVLLAEPGLIDLDIQPSGTPLRLGERIGTLHPGAAGELG